METIGHKLREVREQLGLTLDEVERATRIRTHHLEAIERDDWESLPSPVQARGFLRNYADFLGLDADVVLLDFAALVQGRRTRPGSGNGTASRPAAGTVLVRSRRPRWLSIDLFVAAGVTLAVMAILLWGVSRVMAGMRERTQADLAASSLLLPTSTASLTPTGEGTSAVALLADTTGPTEAVSETPTPPLILGSTNVVDIRLVVEKRAWVRVVVDGDEKYNGRPAPGQSLEFQGQRAIELTTGNGAGLRVFYNGQDQGILGDLGQVVVRMWTLEGVMTPTPSPTGTPTVTPRATSGPVTTPSR